MPPLRKIHPQTVEEHRTTSVFRMRKHRSLQTQQIRQKNYNIGHCFQETATSVCHISDII
ncbi:17818_t:CDS:1, partial [Gigaspora rosea]